MPKEKFVAGDFVTPNILLDRPEGFNIQLGGRYQVESCRNGSTKLVSIEEPIDTDTLMPFPEYTEATIQFALKVVEETLISIPDAARDVGIVQVYMRNLINVAGDHELPNKHIVEIGGKQFVRRSFVENVKAKRAAKNNRLNDTHIQYEQQHRHRTGHNNAPSSKNDGDFDDGRYDQLEELTLAELKGFARQIGTIKLSQNKTNLISDIRRHRAERTE